MEGLEVGAPVSVLDQFELVFEQDDGYFQIGSVVALGVRADRGSIVASATGGWTVRNDQDS